MTTRQDRNLAMWSPAFDLDASESSLSFDDDVDIAGVRPTILLA